MSEDAAVRVAQIDSRIIDRSSDKFTGRRDLQAGSVPGELMIDGKLSLVLPAHNERDNLPFVIDRALEVLPKIVRDHEIIIVDDGSHDGTSELSDSLAEQHESVTAVHHSVNQGYGAALTSGFAAATGDYIMFMDSDRQFDIADLSFLAPFVGDYDFVAGYRVHRRDARHRLIYADIFKTGMRVLFGIKLRDIDCAFKVFRADLLKSMELKSPGALINTEILAKSEQEGARWVEVGVNHYHRQSGSSSGGSLRVILRAMRETILLWFRMKSYEPSGVIEAPDSRSGSRRHLTMAIAGVVVALVASAWTLISRRLRS